METRIIAPKSKCLRDVWKHEAHDFTPWLADAENLKILSKAVGINLTCVETESSVGDFSADILAVDEKGDHKIIIENQLECTNHDHLGKILTYAAGKGADIIIWIVKEARYEHKNAIEWLNEHTDEHFNCFLIELQLWEIDEATASINFNVVVKPNSWAKALNNLSTLKMQQLHFWKGYEEYLKKHPLPKGLSASADAGPRHYYDLKIDKESGCFISQVVLMRKLQLTAGLYVRDKNSDLYHLLRSKSEEIQEQLGCGLVNWPESDVAGRFYVTKDMDLSNPAKWADAYKWFGDLNQKILCFCKQIQGK